MDLQDPEVKDTNNYLNITPALLKETIRRLWVVMSELRNPWLNAAIANLDNYREKFGEWQNKQLVLNRDVFQVVCSDHPPSVELLERMLKFINNIE